MQASRRAWAPPAAVAVSAALVLASGCLLVLLSTHGPSALLASSSAPLHSADYYENLAAADSWEEGPAAAVEAVPTRAPELDAQRGRHGHGRTQLLAQVHAHARLGHRGKALVRLCAGGNVKACARIAGNAHELAALEAEQARQARHVQQQQRRRRTAIAAAGGAAAGGAAAGIAAAASAGAPARARGDMMKAVKTAARSMARQAARGSEDEAGAGNIWDASHWQSGALGDVVYVYMHICTDTYIEIYAYIHTHIRAGNRWDASHWQSGALGDVV